MNNLEKRKKELEGTLSSMAVVELKGIKFAEKEILKLIKDCDFDKNNIAIKEFKQVIEKQIKGKIEVEA